MGDLQLNVFPLCVCVSVYQCVFLWGLRRRQQQKKRQILENPKVWDGPKNEDNPNHEDDPKINDDLKNEVDPKMRLLKKWDDPKN